MGRVLITVRISFCYTRLGIVWVSSIDYALNKRRNITQYIMGERMIYWSKWCNRNILVPLLKEESQAVAVPGRMCQKCPLLFRHICPGDSQHTIGQLTSPPPKALSRKQVLVTGEIWIIVSEKCIIKDFLKHALYQFQAAKHLKDQCSGIYEMIYCVSDHLDTSYQWIIFLCHRKNICFHPAPKPEVIIHFIT